MKLGTMIDVLSKANPAAEVYDGTEVHVDNWGKWTLTAIQSIDLGIEPSDSEVVIIRTTRTD